MTSRGFSLHMSATTRRGLTLAWAALFALSMLFTYAAATPASVLAATKPPAPTGKLHAHTSNTPLSEKVCKQGDFSFLIDRSGSIGDVSGAPAAEVSGVKGFVTSFEGLGSGLYAGTRFSSASTANIPGGFQSAASFAGPGGTLDTNIGGTGGYTPTGAGISLATSNTANDRVTAPNVMFVITDGSPNQPTVSSPPDAADPWLSGANAAIDAAEAARTAGWYVIAIFVGAPDSSLPFSNNQAWVDAVMDAIGGGSHTAIANFNTLASALLISSGCAPETGTLIVKKVVSGGSATSGSFSIHVKKDGVDVAGSPAAGNADPGTSYVLAGGSYVVSENPVANYGGVFSGACNVDGGVTVPNGQTVTCTITNTYTPPPPENGTITVVKHAVGGNGTFDFEICGGSDCDSTDFSITTSGGTGSSATYEFTPGFYHVDEVDWPSGWTPNGTDCNDDGLGTVALSAGEHVTCTFTNTAERIPPPPGLPPSLTIDKTYTGNTGGTATDGTKLSKTGDVLTFTLGYTIVNPPVTGGVITDVLPVGLDYLAGSATSNGIFTFGSYNAGTRTLTWNAPIVLANGSVSYQTTVTATGAQSIDNVTLIDSEQTQPDEGKDTVHLQAVAAETGRPHITLPPTDSIHNGDQSSSNPGLGLLLALLAIAGFGLVTGTLVSRTGRLRREEARRR